MLLIGVLIGPLVARAQETQPPSARTTAVQTTGTLPQRTLSPLNNDSLRRAARREPSRPYVYASLRPISIRPGRDGTWERLPSGDWLWRLQLRSQDARSLGLGFTTARLPEGAALYVYGPDYEAVRGPYTAADITRGEIWTPAVPGDRATVELTVPAGRRSATTLHLTEIGHAFRSLTPSPRRRTAPKSRACNIDVACPRANPWANQVRSVGLYSFQLDDRQATCTGALVNNTNRDGTPYFLTAEHCLQGSESAAASMVFYWNYESSSCRAPGSSESGTPIPRDRTDDTSTGALLRMSYGNCEDTSGFCGARDIAGRPDVTLVEVDDQIPAEYNLFLSGWSRADTAPSTSVTIHHPRGDAKRISFDEDPARITGFGEPGDDHLTVKYDEGTTEVGSSGAPLFGPNRRIRGVLSGGNAGCRIRDWFGRVAEGWTGGGTPDTRLRDWLDPAGTQPQGIDGRNLVRDTIPPAPVAGRRARTSAPDSVRLVWTAPGDDRNQGGPADRYDVRYRTGLPITSRPDFRRARRLRDVPSPRPPGTRQSATVAVDPDSTYYFAIVALDEADNASPLSSLDPGGLDVSSPTPHPVRGRTTFTLSVDEQQPVQVELYDTMGRKVATLFDDVVPSYRRRAVRVNVSRLGLSSGMYFVRVRGRQAARTVKMVVVR